MPYQVTYTPEPTRCAGGEKPGTRILQDWACNESPWAADLWDVGIYNCRTIAGTNTLSQHASGRAGDTAHNIVDGASHPSGIAFALWLVANHAALGIQEVISNRSRWDNQRQRWDTYGGVSPHTDHVHWAQNLAGSLYLTAAQIEAVAPKPPPPEEDDYMPYIVTCDGQPTRLKDGPTCPTIGSSTKANAVRAGVKEIKHTKADYDALLKHVNDALGR